MLNALSNAVMSGINQTLGVGLGTFNPAPKSSTKRVMPTKLGNVVTDVSASRRYSLESKPYFFQLTPPLIVNMSDMSHCTSTNAVLTVFSTNCGRRRISDWPLANAHCV